jgi:GntR family transcriptional regulator/MocR family aminotransferase
MQKEQTNSGSAPFFVSGVDLHLEIVGERLGAGLAEALREAVRSGRLRPGTRLPASRVLAHDLGISRSTVTECYSELVAEGWFTSRQGSGTSVAFRAGPPNATPNAEASPPVRLGSSDGLLPGAPDFAEFPRSQWLAAARRALNAAPFSAYGYGDPGGSLTLRRTLADYLARVRGVRTQPDQIVICSGFHHGLTLVARALAARGARAVAVEAYGLDLYRDVLAQAGLSTPLLDVDGSGARVDELAASGADAVLLTPAHQFPTGVALSPARRIAVREWARTTGGLVLEDDYDGEFRYDRKPVGALQGLDPERVVYFGTASKSLAPALRVGWMVVPHDLVADVLAAKGAVETVSVLDQLTFAEFIASGGFDRHLRARRQGYRHRREQLIAALAERVPHVHAIGMAAGLQIVLDVPEGTERLAVEAAGKRGLAVSGLSEFRHGPAAGAISPADAVVVNYSAVSDSAWVAALEALCEALAELPPSPAAGVL